MISRLVFSTVYFGLLSLAPLSTFAQDAWIQQSAPPPLNDIHFPTPAVGYAIGPDGLFMKTSDGGDHWVKRTTGTALDLNGVFFNNADTGYVVGTGGVILKTTDGGMTWKKVPNRTGPDLQHVNFLTEKIGFASGASGVFLRTSDAGATWTSRVTGGSGSFGDISFVDTSNGYVGGGWGFVNKTVNGGATWTKLTLPQNDEVTSVHFFTAKRGIVSTTNDWTFRTLDSGKTWESIRPMSLSQLKSMHFPDSTTGYCVGFSGTLLKTVDGGTNWKQLNPGTGIYNTDRAVAVHFPTPKIGCAVGLDGIILCTKDGGDTWAVRSNGLNKLVSEAYFTSPDTGMVIGYPETLIRTVDGGATWVPQTIGNAMASLDFVRFPEAKTGFILSSKGAVYKSTDGGAVWASVGSLSLTAGASPEGMFFTDVKNGFVVEGSKRLYQTTDGGVTWTNRILDTSARSLECLHFPTKSTGFILDYFGILFKTTDGGTNWVRHKLDSMSRQSSIFFTDSLTGFSCDQSVIHKSTDGGLTWKKVWTGSGDLRNIHFADSQNGLVVGRTGAVLVTSDAGETWTSDSITIPGVQYIASGQMIDSRTMVVVGQGVFKKGRTTTLKVPVLASPADKSTDMPAKIDLAWKPVAGATGYSLQVATDSAFKGIAFSGSVGMDTSKSVGPLKNATVHFWRVRAEGPGGYGEWSAVRRFTTVAAVGVQPPVAPMTTLFGWERAGTLQYELKEAGQVRVVVFDSRGKLVSFVMQGRQEAGRHFLTIPSEGISRGIYFVDFATKGFNKRMRFLRY